MIFGVSTAGRRHNASPVIASRGRTRAMPGCSCSLSISMSHQRAPLRGIVFERPRPRFRSEVQSRVGTKLFSSCKASNRFECPWSHFVSRRTGTTDDEWDQEVRDEVTVLPTSRRFVRDA